MRVWTASYKGKLLGFFPTKGDACASALEYGAKGTEERKAHFLTWAALHGAKDDYEGWLLYADANDDCGAEVGAAHINWGSVKVLVCAGLSSLYDKGGISADLRSPDGEGKRFR